MPSRLVSKVELERLLLELGEKWESKWRAKWVTSVKSWSSSEEFASLISDLRAGRSMSTLLSRMESIKLPAPLLNQAIVDMQLAANETAISAYGWNTNAQVTDAMSRFGATQVKGLSKSAQQSMRQALRDAMDTGMTVDQTAASIKDSLSLDQRSQIALKNYRTAVQQNPGMSRGLQQRRVEEYKARLTAHRAKTIARTEVMSAINRGHRNSYLAALKNGLLDATDQVQWITASDEKVCTVCGPLHGKTTSLGEGWYTAAGVLFDPPAHPNCRCTTTLAL